MIRTLSSFFHIYTSNNGCDKNTYECRFHRNFRFGIRGSYCCSRTVRKGLPRYDYLYLGDNARAHMVRRSFRIVYEFTKQAVFHLFDEGCSLVILASIRLHKALRSIQQKICLVSLPINGFEGYSSDGRVALSELSRTGHIRFGYTEF